MSIIRKSLNIAGNDHWEADAGAKTGSPRRSEPGRSLREEYSRQREENVQMSQVGSLLGIFNGKL